MSTSERHRRSRDGCWTCKKRKKKCDGKVFPCGNCLRLGIECQADTRLVWEDDVRRDGMRKRGPPKSRASAPAPTTSSNFPLATNQSSGTSGNAVPGEISTREDRENHQSQGHLGLSRLVRPSEWPFELDNFESQLLNRYIQRFSRTYPAFSGPTNPFLRVFLPLAMRNRAILDGVLALSGVQNWENGRFSMEVQMLNLRQQALKGCMKLVADVMSRSSVSSALPAPSNVENALQLIADRSITLSDDDILNLLTASNLLFLYELLTGESPGKGAPHLQLFARLFPIRLFSAVNEHNIAGSNKSHWGESVQFLSSLFLYNDLIRSTSFGTPVLSGLDCLSRGDIQSIQRVSSGKDTGRFHFPNIIANISNGDIPVTDDDIAGWDGRLDWFPSFALLPQEARESHERLPTANQAFVFGPEYSRLESVLLPLRFGSDQGVISELYRVAATMYRKQYSLKQLLNVSTGVPRFGLMLNSQETQMGNLPSWAIQLITLLAPGSLFESTLLWPIGIVARELVAQSDREYIIYRLVLLEQRFAMKHFHVVKQRLIRGWALADQGIICTDEQPILFG